MHWLQAEEDGTYNLQALQLDIVGFLAILGEGSVLANAQVSTLSRWIFLPRLIPAPQALMRPTRPLDLEPVRGDVSGVKSGNDKDHVNHIGNIICDANNLPRHSVRVVTIKRINDASIKAKEYGPLTYVALLGFSLSAMLLGLSIHLRDGMSIVATALLSLLSSLIGLGNYWTLPGAKVQKEDHVPPGDVVIRYPKGSFLVVRCVEDVARELYFAPEEIEYLIEDAWVYRLLSLIGTMMLMGGVICLANARIESQIAWAGSYMLLGSAYWIVAALPAKVHWDTSCYKVTSEALHKYDIYKKRNIFSRNKKGYPFTKSKSFTEALWKAIVASKDATWVRRGDHCPESKVWDDWLHMAKTCSREYMDPMTEKNKDGFKVWEIPEWDPSEYLQHLFKEEKRTKEQV
ncbi:hypothetical protein BU25DRAFT_341998 [Macroventuria anomochaeta]|uniref:Uncharacterized protein n=1 Tax=Macroventuria anomochaeta TaxID=301207 RepID=A0ACB6RZ63_9PLEO|nr:uncharacterized protein BU25DRAFT_341998 [Macroventuria anomochaeta]KAF2627270.1 hypothetical protein BU25DRAFT_341998 [Macroventuria anomochaeta]